MWNVTQLLLRILFEFKQALLNRNKTNKNVMIVLDNAHTAVLKTEVEKLKEKPERHKVRDWVHKVIKSFNKLLVYSMNFAVQVNSSFLCWGKGGGMG